MSEALGPGDHSRSVSVAGLARSYLLHVPASFDGSSPAPVVLAFHGGGTNARHMVHFSGLNDTSDRAGFLIVYPNGSGRVERALSWNAGNCCGYAMRYNVDDVGFVRALLEDLGRVVSVDPTRVFATGISNGGMLCYRLACELSQRIAAIAPVAGPMGTAECHPKRPVSVVHFHGTDDKFAPFSGGKGASGSNTVFFSVEHSIRFWVEANGCPPQPQISEFSDPQDDSIDIERKAYGPGRDGSEVVLFVIHGGGHTWPGREPQPKLLGKATTALSANDLMWEFFQRHPMG